MELMLILLIRLLLPLTILRWPLAGVGLCIIADTYDYGAMTQSFIGGHNYQYVDKLLDSYYQLFMAYKSYFWLDKRAVNVSLFLIFYRLFGVSLFFLTGQEYLLFFFPNLFIDFYLFYEIFRKISGSNILIRSKTMLIPIGVSLTVPKLMSEYTLHVSRIMEIQLPQTLQTFYALSEPVQMILYVMPALLVLILYATVAARDTPPPKPLADNNLRPQGASENLPGQRRLGN